MKKRQVGKNQKYVKLGIDFELTPSIRMKK